MLIKIVHDEYLDMLEVAVNEKLEELKDYEIVNVEVRSYNFDSSIGFYATITYTYK